MARQNFYATLTRDGRSMRVFGTGVFLGAVAGGSFGSSAALEAGNAAPFLLWAVAVVVGIGFMIAGSRKQVQEVPA